MIKIKESLTAVSPARISLVIALANKMLNEIGFVEAINKGVEWKNDPRGMSPGKLLKALVLTTFTDIRAPLTHISERLMDMDLYYLLGYDAYEYEINAFNVGRALEHLGKADPEGIYESLALTAVQKYQIPIERTHNDTTTLSFYGSYDLEKMNLSEEMKEEILQIEKGYNKDNRPGDCQAVVGQTVTQDGILLSNQTMNGSISDVEWNAKALDYLDTIRNKGFNSGLFVADSKLVNQKLVIRMCSLENYVPFVSRCPANFADKLESKMIKKAYEADDWQDIGQVSTVKNSSTYRLKSYTKTIFGKTMRLVVLESSSLVEAAEKSLAKAKEKLLPLVLKLEKREFACQKDAEKELAIFRRSKEQKLFEYTPEIIKTTKEKWPRGRRNAETCPTIIDSYKIKITKLDFNPKQKNQYLQNKSAFVLISNVIDEETTDEMLLRTYKGQHVVENSFRQLKSPNLASVIYLKNPIRIKALTTILCLSLLIRALIQFKMRKGLKEFNAEHPNEVIYAGWGGKPLKSPTFKLLYEHSINSFYECVSSNEYRFSWSSSKMRDLVQPLLFLMDESVESILN